MPGKPLALDDIDHRLLAELQADADRTLRDLGELVGLSSSAVLRRVEGYKAGGLLERKVAVLDTSQVPDLVLAVCLVTVERQTPEHRRAFCDLLKRTPQVQQVYDVSGVWDYVVILAAHGLPEVRELAERLFEADENVRKLTTLFVLDPVKTGCAVPTRPMEA
jgi:DNA-binding Lrp family transcriptional regulator